MKRDTRYSSQSKEYIIKQILKRTIKRHFLQLVPQMDRCEYDALIYDLQRLYEVNRHDS